MSETSTAAKLRLSAFAVLLNLGGWALLAFTSHHKLIGTIAATVAGAVWTGIVGLTSGIWHRIESTLVEIIGGRIDVQVRDLLSGYRKNYLAHIRNRYGTFDVKGLITQEPFSLNIEQVYVELTLVATQTARVATHPLQSVVRSEDSGDIWTLLTSLQDDLHNFVILGPPGSGKTTLLTHLTVILAARSRLSKLKFTPVLLFIRDYADAIVSNPNQTIIDIINTSVSKMEMTAPHGWFQREPCGEGKMAESAT